MVVTCALPPPSPPRAGLQQGPRDVRVGRPQGRGHLQAGSGEGQVRHVVVEPAVTSMPGMQVAYTQVWQALIRIAVINTRPRQPVLISTPVENLVFFPFQGLIPRSVAYSSLSSVVQSSSVKYW
jgi:hypothetical protein